MYTVCMSVTHSQRPEEEENPWKLKSRKICEAMWVVVIQDQSSVKAASALKYLTSPNSYRFNEFT